MEGDELFCSYAYFFILNHVCFVNFFLIANLKLYSKELMINDEIINQSIYKIEYKGKEISNDHSSTRGFGLEIQLHG